MSRLPEFAINIQNLENREYLFDFRINDDFFKEFENSPVNHGDLKCRVALQKTSSFIRINFTIDGWVELTCDRSLDLFNYKLSTTGQWICKFGNVNAEVDDETSIITRTRQDINLSQNIYELISTSVPMKKLHPRFAEDLIEKDEFIYSTGRGNFRENKEQDMPDPRWEILRKLKEKNK